MACQTLRYPSRSAPSPIHSFHATLAKNRATWDASDEGTVFGSRSSCSSISFMMSDIFRSDAFFFIDYPSLMFADR